ncbi:hypothetical protein [Pseudomonas purpurea]|uniref:hypothetical protein n=1 Tax=Pseudomonas purpurea TaxID=3136737 RepID=UPI003266C3D8
MANEAVNASYEKMAQDAMDDQAPRPKVTCTACAELGVPFAINGPSGPRDADLLLGIPSNEKAATADWFTSNKWIKDKVQNFRDSYLLQVIDSLGKTHGEAYLAELYSFLAAKGYEFVCMDDEIETEDYVTPRFWAEVAGIQPTPPTIACGSSNFVFHSGRIYFWTFTSARYVDDRSIGPRGERSALPHFDWTITGQYDPAKAARDLAQHYQRAKEIDKTWMKVYAVTEIVFGVLTLVPVVGTMGRGLFGAYKGIRYAIAAIDTALALNAIGSGSTKLITGENIDVGEKLFASLGRLADPKDGGERGRQVFMFINLVMLTPAAFGGARWILRKIRRAPASAALDVKVLNEEQRKRLGGHTSAEPLAIELRGTKRETGASAKNSGNETGPGEWFDRPSLDTNSSQVGYSTPMGKANYAVMSNSLQSRLSLLIIQHCGSLKVVGRICKMVGDAGEEAFAASLIKQWGVLPGRILGYSNNAKIPNRFGLSNKSGHGLDMLVWVPPPPSITVRTPTDAMRHVIDGSNGIAPTKTFTFTEDTLLVIETKSTLGGAKTPRFNSTQQGGGAGKLQSLRKKISSQKSGWTPEKMAEVEPNYREKMKAIDSAQRNGRIEYFHAQIFFDSQGNLSKLVGNGSGIQLNTW